MDSVAGHLLANHRGLMQQVKIKEVLTEYYRIWLIIQHPSQFDEYVKTLEIGIAPLEWRDFFCYLPDYVVQDPVTILAFGHIYDFWSTLHILPPRSVVQELENNKDWKVMIDVVYQNLEMIEKKKKQLRAEKIN